GRQLAACIDCDRRALPRLRHEGGRADGSYDDVAPHGRGGVGRERGGRSFAPQGRPKARIAPPLGAASDSKRGGRSFAPQGRPKARSAPPLGTASDSERGGGYCSPLPIFSVAKN